MKDNDLKEWMKRQLLVQSRDGIVEMHYDRKRGKTIQREYVLEVTDDTWKVFVDKEGVIWLPRPMNAIGQKLGQRWLQGELSVGIDRDGSLIFQTRNKPFFQESK